METVIGSEMTIGREAIFWYVQKSLVLLVWNKPRANGLVGSSRVLVIAALTRVRKAQPPTSKTIVTNEARTTSRSDFDIKSINQSPIYPLTIEFLPLIVLISTSAPNK